MIELESFNLLAVMPEIIVALMGIILLVYGVFEGNKSYRVISWYVVLTFLTVGGILLCLPQEITITFDGMFVTEPFAVFMKILVLVGASLALIMSIKYMEREKLGKIEYPILILFSTLGMMVMLSANDLISLYMGLELQSLPLYILAAFNRSNLKSSEAGLKYFVLGALSSGLLLYGCSMIYGFSGTTNFVALSDLFAFSNGELLGVTVGLVFILAGLAFKISAVPFHMWAPDVYEGAPSSVTTFFAMVPKIAAMGLLVRVTMGVFGEMTAQWQQVLTVIAMGSMIVGGLGAIVQTNIRRLMAYSSIGHMGYALIGLIAATAMGLQGLIIYMLIYMLTTAGVFAVILLMVRKGLQVETISDLSGLAQYRPLTALCMAILMFSMAGIPPLAGFFGKLFVFQAAMEQGMYALSIVGVITSVIAAYYYLRIIKVMYFDEPLEQLDVVEDAPALFVMRLSSFFAVIFIIVAWPVVEAVNYVVESFLNI